MNSIKIAGKLFIVLCLTITKLNADDLTDISPYKIKARYDYYWVPAKILRRCSSSKPLQIPTEMQGAYSAPDISGTVQPKNVAYTYSWTPIIKIGATGMEKALMSVTEHTLNVPNHVMSYKNHCWSESFVKNENDWVYSINSYTEFTLMKIHAWYELHYNPSNNSYRIIKPRRSFAKSLFSRYNWLHPDSVNRVAHKGMTSHGFVLGLMSFPDKITNRLSEARRHGDESSALNIERAPEFDGLFGW